MKNKKSLLTLALGHLSTDVNGGALPALLPYMRASCDLTYQATASLMFAHSCLASLIQPAFGWLADKYPSRWPIPVGIAITGVSLAAVGFLTNYWAIFAAIMLSGIGSAIFHPEGARLTNRISGSHKGKAISIFAIGGNCGFVLGPILVTAFVGGFGMQGMAGFGLLGLVMAGIVIWELGRIAKQEGIQVGAQAKAAQKADSGSNDWREFAKLTLMIMMRSTVFMGFKIFIPLLLIQQFALTEEQAAMALALFAVCGIISNMAGGWLADKYGYLNIIRLSFCLLVPLTFMAGMIKSTLVVLSLIPLLGFSLYVAFSPLVVTGQKILAKNVGFASGVTLGLNISFGGMAAPVLGWIADLHGPAWVLQSLGWVALGAALCSFWLKNKPKGEAA